MMPRRKNILDEKGLGILESETKSYVESFQEAINCELRKFKITHYKIIHE